MRFVAGIDGGGTKTTLIIYSLDNGETEKKVFGAFNINSIGEEAFRSLLGDISCYLNSKGECLALCIGAAGISNVHMKDAISSVLCDNKIHNWKLVGDHEIALEGAFEGKSGIILIAGTGSICFGKSDDGTLERSGGWGHLIGDEGSGYGLGKDAIIAVSKEIDGYGRPTILRKLLSENLDLSDRSDIISYVYSKDKSAIALIEPIVEKAAGMGDEVAKEIIRDNAEKLAIIVKSVGDKLKNDDDLPLTLHGGVIANDTLLKKAFLEALAKVAPNIHFVKPKNDAANGALLLARKMIDA